MSKLGTPETGRDSLLSSIRNVRALIKFAPVLTFVLSLACSSKEQDPEVHAQLQACRVACAKLEGGLVAAKVDARIIGDPENFGDSEEQKLDACGVRKAKLETLAAGLVPPPPLPQGFTPLQPGVPGGAPTAPPYTLPPPRPIPSGGVPAAPRAPLPTAPIPAPAGRGSALPTPPASSLPPAPAPAPAGRGSALPATPAPAPVMPTYSGGELTR